MDCHMTREDLLAFAEKWRKIGGYEERARLWKEAEASGLQPNYVPGNYQTGAMETRPGNAKGDRS
jgi:hypothetical protein